MALAELGKIYSLGQTGNFVTKTLVFFKTSYVYQNKNTSSFLRISACWYEFVNSVSAKTLGFGKCDWIGKRFFLNGTAALYQYHLHKGED